MFNMKCKGDKILTLSKYFTIIEKYLREEYNRRI